MLAEAVFSKTCAFTVGTGSITGAGATSWFYVGTSATDDEHLHPSFPHLYYAFQVEFFLAVFLTFIFKGAAA